MRGRRSRHRRCNLSPADRAIAPGNTIEMDRIDDPQPAPLRLLVNRDLVHAMADPHLASRDGHRDALTNKAPRYRVTVGVDLDGTIFADDPG